MTPEERFWAKVDRSSADGCWTWTGFRNEAGYGLFRIHGRTVAAHRFSLELVHGPLGKLYACHHCDNPPCVRTDHLFPGTPLDNYRDAAIKARFTIGSSRRPPVTDEVVREIRERSYTAWKEGRPLYQNQLAAEYGVRQTWVSSILSYKARPHVGPHFPDWPVLARAAAAPQEPPADE